MTNANVMAQFSIILGSDSSNYVVFMRIYNLPFPLSSALSSLSGPINVVHLS